MSGFAKCVVIETDAEDRTALQKSCGKFRDIIPALRWSQDGTIVRFVTFEERNSALKRTEKDQKFAEELVINAKSSY